MSAKLYPRVSEPGYYCVADEAICAGHKHSHRPNPHLIRQRSECRRVRIRCKCARPLVLHPPRENGRRLEGGAGHQGVLVTFRPGPRLPFPTTDRLYRTIRARIIVQEPSFAAKLLVYAPLNWE